MFGDYFDRDDGGGCACRPAFETPTVGDGAIRLGVDADDCPGDGDLAAAPACRATVVAALADRDADLVVTRSDGRARTYAGHAATLLVAAGRFHERARIHDDHLADCARVDPLGAARTATGRPGPLDRIATETGLAECAANAPVGGPDGPEVGWPSDDRYATVLAADVAPTVALGRIAPDSPEGRPVETWSLDGGATVRRFETDGPRDLLHLRPASAGLDATATRALQAAYDRLAAGGIEGGDRAPDRAVRAVVPDGLAGVDSADDDQSPFPVETLSGVLRRHTRGLGYVGDLLAVPGVSDLAVTAPVGETPVRITVDGRRATTNVTLSRADAETLASRVRAESGRGLSRASPAADATLDGVRVAAVTDPASDGPAFAFRTSDDDGDDDPWTLARLVACGTMPARAAALLSLAVGRGAAGLVAGPRGAGKTTTLAALLWALPPAVRTVVIEDTPELPVATLRADARDVQRLRVSTDDGAAFTPTDAVRTALRLGEGALVVGEVRGEEARALYEAMRVGAAADAVLGTIHGSGAASVRERVVSDLGVARSAFGATDFVVTVDPDHTLAAIEEVRTEPTTRGGDSGAGSDGAGEPNEASGTRFAPLFERAAADVGPTGVLTRGDSHLLDALSTPRETYRDALDELDARTRHAEQLALSGRTTPDARIDGRQTGDA